MESAEQLLTELERRAIRLSHAAGKLHCNAPKGSMTPALRDSIKQHKTALIRLLDKHQHKTVTTSQNTLLQRSANTERPLSFAQERIWYLSKLDPENHFTGNIHFSFGVSGPLDIQALEQAITILLQRHEVLRTCCETINNRPQQSVIPVTAFRLAVRDVRHLAEPEQSATIHDISYQHATAPFDLSQVPILRAQLLQTGDTEYIFLLATHLYVFDGWSTALILRELSLIYNACHTGNDVPLEPLSAQYADFAHWHRHWFSSDTAAQQRLWWQEKLADTALISGIKANSTTPLSLSKSASVEFALPALLTKATHGLARNNGVTLFIVLQAAFQTLLYAYTRQAKLATGTIVSNRRLAETEAMIGSFANNILLPVDFSGGINFSQLLQQIAQTAREVYARQDLPFEYLYGALNSSLTHHPLFRFMFVLHQHNAQAQQNNGLNLDGLNVTKLPDTVTLSKYELELVMVDRNNGLSGLFVYNADSVAADTATTLKNNFLKILKTVCDQPEQPLEALPTLQGQFNPLTTAATKQSADYVAPRDTLEQDITMIWQQLFGLEHISVNQTFTELGGHSLLAIRLLQVLQAKFNTSLPLTTLVKLPTIAELAVYLRQASDNRVNTNE